MLIKSIERWAFSIYLLISIGFSIPTSHGQYYIKSHTHIRMLIDDNRSEFIEQETTTSKIIHYPESCAPAMVQYRFILPHLYHPHVFRRPIHFLFYFVYSHAPMTGYASARNELFRITDSEKKLSGILDETIDFLLSAIAIGFFFRKNRAESSTLTSQNTTERNRTKIIAHCRKATSNQAKLNMKTTTDSNNDQKTQQTIGFNAATHSPIIALCG